MLLKYFNRLNKLNIPDYLIKPDVTIEIPFKYGYVNYYPYYKEGEIILDFDKISKLEKILYSQDAISTEAIETLENLTLDDLYNCIFNPEKQISRTALKYEFENLYYKLIGLTKEKNVPFGKLELEDDLYCKTSLNELESAVGFQFHIFSVTLTTFNQNGELIVSNFWPTKESITYQDVQDYKELINNNLDKFE